MFDVIRHTFVKRAGNGPTSTTFVECTGFAGLPVVLAEKVTCSAQLLPGSS